VEWHLRQVWAPLLFEDEQLVEERSRRDPVLPARSSESAQAKKHTHQTTDGLPVQSFATLLANLVSQPRSRDLQLENGRVRSHFSASTDADPTASQGL
jgi:hypothetical protein